MRIEQLMPDRITSLSCSLLGYSRQAYYQYQKQQEKEQFQEELIIKEVLQHRRLQKRLGGRKLFCIMQMFFQQHSINMGRDAFFTLLRESGLLIRIRKRKAITTQSNHVYRKYPNLIKEFIPIKPNQLWVCDITYIHVGDGFAYLSLITDGYSHKIVGFCLCETLSAQGPIQALRHALLNNPDARGAIHHSDRGVQYCCTDYVSILTKNKCKISMSEKGNPRENPVAERVNGILKTELLEDHYPSFDAALAHIAVAISTYNHLRPHNSIGNMKPFDVHALHEGGSLKKLWKNYYKPKQKEVIMTD